MASLNSVHLEKKREAYLATAKPISSLLVDDSGDENYGDVPDGQFPEDAGYNNADSRPVMSDEPVGSFGDGLRPMRPTDIREAQLKQMSAAEKDFYFVQGDVNVTSNDTSYNTEYEESYADDGYSDDEFYDDYEFSEDEYDDEDIIDDTDAYSDPYDDSNEFELELDFTDLDDDLDEDGFIVVDNDGDIDIEDDDYDDDFDDEMDYDDEEQEDLREIVSLLQSMGISSFGDDFDDGYGDLTDDLITVASIAGKQHQSRRKEITGTIPVTPASRPTDSDSTAAANGVSRKPKHGGEMRGSGQTSGKSSKVYGLLFK